MESPLALMVFSSNLLHPNTLLNSISKRRPDGERDPTNTHGTPRTFDRGRGQETCRQDHDGDADSATRFPFNFFDICTFYALGIKWASRNYPSFGSQIHAAVASHSNRTGNRSWPPTDSLRVAGLQS
jgi:hypothetical protein